MKSRQIEIISKFQHITNAEMNDKKIILKLYHLK